MRPPTASKRKRSLSDDNGDRLNKILRGQLLRRYAKRERDIAEVLNGGNTNVGHIVGDLEAVDRDPSNKDLLSLRIRDASGRILTCDFNAPHFKGNINFKIGRKIKIAILRAVCLPIKNPPDGHEAYDHKLLFDQYQFLLDGELFEDHKGKGHPAWMMDSEDEEDEKSPEPSARGARKSTTDLSRSDLCLPVPASGQSELAWTSLHKALKEHPQGSLTIAGVVKHVSRVPARVYDGWGTEVHIVDSSCTNSQFLELKLYAKVHSHLPPFETDETGTVLLISGVKICTKGRFVYGIAKSEFYRYVCYPNEAGLPYIQRPNADPFQTPIYQYSDRELLEMKRLRAWYMGEPLPPALQFQGPTPVHHEPRTSMGHYEKHRLIQDVRLGEMFDCTVEVLKVLHSGSPAVWVTDYTSNPLLRDPSPVSYPNKPAWFFPSGQKSLLIQLFDNPREQAMMLEPGFIFRFRHVRLTKGDNDKYGRGKCGNLKKSEPNEIVRVSKTDGDPHWEALMRRKEALGSGEGGIKSRYTEQKHREARSTRQDGRDMVPDSTDEDVKDKASDLSQICITSETAPSPLHSDTMKPTSNAKSNKTSSTGAPMKSEPVKRLKFYPTFPAYGLDVEPSPLIVASRAAALPLTSIKEIQRSPMVPELFKFRGRIVDVEPRDLRDAVVRFCTECDNTCVENEKGRCGGCDRRDCMEYRVRVEIIFQDASGELPVKVADATAIKFFRLTKKALHNREETSKQLLERFKVIMTPSFQGSDEYEVKGVSEIFELVVRNWQIAIQPAGAASLYPKRYHALSGCRIVNARLSGS